jgi:hypothetical protein
MRVMRRRRDDEHPLYARERLHETFDVVEVCKSRLDARKVGELLGGACPGDDPARIVALE